MNSLSTLHRHVNAPIGVAMAQDLSGSSRRGSGCVATGNNVYSVAQFVIICLIMISINAIP